MKKALKPLLLALFFVLVISAGIASAQDPPAAPGTIDIDVVKKPFALVAGYIRDFSGLNVVLGPDRDGRPLLNNKDSLVTIRFEKVPCAEALRLVCETAGVTLDLIDGNVWYAHQPPEITLALQDVPVSSVLGMIARISCRNVVWRRGPLETDLITVKMDAVPWFEALQYVAKASGAVVMADADEEIFYVTRDARDTANGLWRPWAGPSKPAGPEGDPLVDIDVTDKSLYAVAMNLGEFAGRKVSFGRDRRGEPMKRSKALGVTLKLRGARFTTALRLAAESCGARLKILECGDCFLYENPDSFIDVRGSGLSAALLTAAKLGGLDLAASVQDAALPSVSARLSGIGWDKSLRTLAALGGFALAEDSPGRFRLTAPGMESLPKENQESILNAWNLKIRQLNIDLIQAGEGQGESGRLLKAWKSLLMEMRAAVLKGPLDAERARLLSMLEALKESVLSTEGEILKVRMKGLAVEMEELLETAGAEASMGCFIRGLDSIATLQELLEEGLHAGRWDEHLQRPFAALLRGVDAALAGDGAKPGLETAARVTRELSRGPIAALPGTAGFLEKLAARANAAKAMIEFNGLGVRLEGVFCSSREKVAILNGRCFREGDAFTLADLGLAGDSGVKMELLEIRPDSPAVVKFKGVGMALRLVQK